MTDEDPLEEIAKQASDEPTQKNVTSVVQPSLFEELEDWRAKRDLSRSEAIRELMREALEDETWADEVSEAQDLLSDSDLVAFALGTVREDGDGQVRLSARAGFGGDLLPSASEESETLVLGLLKQIDAYAEMAGADTETVLEALLRLHRQREEGAGAGSG